MFIDNILVFVCAESNKSKAKKINLNKQSNPTPNLLLNYLCECDAYLFWLGEIL